jgi:hypothetical protein
MGLTLWRPQNALTELTSVETQDAGPADVRPPLEVIRKA